ncbi:helix-turn-helix domain-containing protein [Texcoconibacillus texcoconensis]|uniref:Transcriptional regulator with XRE-family HTH domain n=1 Tax=Texcoconibacillus texcoconensis TaxID=1095777 RepID=A0A840QKN0_9BACI|nr:helix-turn-helix domain-containing protein [Texcoconibacillus texcoconensis]MBB5171967.1 transcriptional regulator with XRE-family HTH domain [Texcoconibacillus texcoconensis]
MLHKNWLIELRKSKKMTQEEVAAAAYINRAYYSQIETGKRTPSLDVAINISQVLGFDPFMFFQDHFHARTPEDDLNYSICASFKAIENSSIVYLYNHPESYLQNVISFLITAVEKEIHCLIIDDDNNIHHIHKQLESLFSENKHYKKNYIHIISRQQIINNNHKRTVETFLNLQRQFQAVRIWINEQKFNENDWLRTLENHLNQKQLANFENVFLLRSYNASMISAKANITMMRLYPYIMTDFEIVSSPLYSANNHSIIFPSLFIQDNM